jgi:glycosyltransferase involved in cell wall biosynthesis
MHILYIHQYFAVPRGSTGTRSYEFARRWVKAGHKVTLITCDCDITGLEPKKGVMQKRVIEGINVIITGIRYGHNQSFLRRILAFLCFMFFSIYVGLRTKEIDVIYATSTPLTIGIPAIVLKWLKRIPFVFEVRDQWPEIPIELGIIKNRILIKILLWLEKTIYKQSVAIVALSPGMAAGVKLVLKKHKKNVLIIPNSSDTDLFKPDIDGSKVRKEKGWQNKLIFLHAGAMGMANGLDFVIEVADRLTDYNDIHFVLMGGGRQRDMLAGKIKSLGLKNIELLDFVSKNELPQIFAACDVSIVIFADYVILEHNSANKFFDSLSSGKPVLLNYSGWQRKILEENKAGFGCISCDVDEFVEKVLCLASHRGILAEMGKNARRIAEKEFDRNDLAGQALSLLLSVSDNL